MQGLGASTGDGAVTRPEGGTGTRAGACKRPRAASGGAGACTRPGIGTGNGAGAGGGTVAVADAYT